MYPADRITTPGEQDVNGWMKSQAINTTEVAMIGADHLKIHISQMYTKRNIDPEL